MKAATLSEIKKELKHRDPEEIMQICLRLGRFKKDNKELLTYLLFDASDEETYISSIKYEIDDMIEEINTDSLYYAKKGLQKINRNLNKYIRYSGNKQTEVEVLIHFAKAMKSSGIPIHRSSVISNLYDRLLTRAKKALLSLHDDMRVDYEYDLEML
ncbi:hypothetical protein JMN32_19485 [Fulvivirga sp. 29W222]|uniref:Uncharacterized protein n=1 Tax=Fulvivirga marina TaxID=2494733 RepID=A0A937KDD8_9BACT|nr:hypothetical protein [Fulvivirga marina]MBL6448502.1 hypothetical protein [Fulvivirga marina]